MRYQKIFILLLTMVLAVACDSGKSPSFKKGNPYSKEYFGINGPVKYALFNHYKKGYVDQAIRMDFSPEGMLVKKRTFEKGDSIVNNYTYDGKNNIQSISGTDVGAYKNEFQKGNLTKEWFYSDEDQTEGFTLRYQVEGEKLIKKQNDIKTGKGVTTTYAYTSKGILQQEQQMQNDGSYTKNVYDADDHLTSIEHYGASGSYLYKEDINADYDEYNNLIKYQAKKNGKVKAYYKVVYKYYTEDELNVANQQAESTITSNGAGYEDKGEASAPSKWLLVAISVISLLFLFIYLSIAIEEWHLFKNFGGETEIDGMRKMWMYNSRPYVRMAILFAILLAAFLSSIILLLLFGGVVWVLFWAIKLIFWAIIVIGWICLVGGIIGTIGGAFICLIPAVIGGIIVAFQDTLKGWGELFVAWGSEFLDNVNAIDWTISIYENYGTTILAIALTPLVCFLLLAIILIVISTLLRLYEFASMKIYNVHRPCPFCGNTHDFKYMIDGEEWSIPLHPGLYGILHQTNHDTGVRVPTMLMNGKAKLTRKCPNCERLVNEGHDKTYGTDIHIGIVGARSSGKSYMLYSGLEMLSQHFGDDFEQTDSDSNNKLADVTKRIHNGDGIQTAVKNRYKAIQFKLKRKWRPVPYHLFFYDVAGEKFNASTNKSQAALEFYNKVKTVVFIIDPTMTDIDKVVPSDAFTEWFKKHGNQSEKYDTEGTLSELKNILTQQVGRKTKDIDIIITCTKKDLGYLENSNYTYDLDENMIKKFISEELGLANVINSVSDFKSVSYAAVSATAEDRSALEELFLNILKQRGIKMD